MKTYLPLLVSMFLPATLTAAPVINEIESSGGSPSDWIELYNTSENSIDLSGWALRDNRNYHTYTMPQGTGIDANDFMVFDRSELGFSLGRNDAVRLFDSAGNLIDSYTYSGHADTTYGRCPDGVGTFVTTLRESKGTANVCEGSSGGEPVVLQDWPGSDVVATVDPANTFSSNLSGLHYEPANGGSPNILWSVQNGPSRVDRLVWNGSNWAPESGAWADGKEIRHPNGSDEPDSEGITKAEWDDAGFYVAIERNKSASGSRLSILRYDENAAGSTLTATHEWNLTGLLPAASTNQGLEGITWIPDSYLLDSGFFDELEGELYAPANYPNHGTGLFVVGLEENGMLYFLALNHANSSASLIATVDSGFDSNQVMGLEFDRDTELLWAGCDNNCDNQLHVLQIDQDPVSPNYGRFVVTGRFNPPSQLPNANNEGIALQPQTDCSGGEKGFFWADDNNTNNHAVRLGSVFCGTDF